MDSLEPELLHTATRFPSSFLGVAKIEHIYWRDLALPKR